MRWVNILPDERAVGWGSDGDRVLAIFRAAGNPHYDHGFRPFRDGDGKASTLTILRQPISLLTLQANLQTVVPVGATTGPLLLSSLAAQHWPRPAAILW